MSDKERDIGFAAKAHFDKEIGGIVYIDIASFYGDIVMRRALTPEEARYISDKIMSCAINAELYANNMVDK